AVGWTKQDVDDVLFYGVLGVVLGGRLGYCLFYKPDYYVSHLIEVRAVWNGGMSFHGGLLGVLLGLFLFARRRGRGFFEVSDLIAP
uniref:prolipoprotein diacylglyceryl transferase family protein n=1 Tax=Escherichia coli TaxID=562 RepID=UPI0019542A6D